MNPRWFSSSLVRKATSFKNHVARLFQAQRDLLSPVAAGALVENLGALERVLSSNDPAQIENKITGLEKAADKWLKPYPHAGWRENVEVFLVAIAVALGVRTFFLQPFKIPTGSMQPTLYGIVSENLKNHPGAVIPGGFRRIYEACILGISYPHLVAETEGSLRAVDPPQRVLPFVQKQRFWIDDQPHTLWFPPDQVERRAGLLEGQYFRAGEDIIKLKVQIGDHLFVDRVTYNFRHPRRGEIIVFETRGIPGLPTAELLARTMPLFQMPQDQFYIKRAVALGGDRVRIGNDRHLVINGERLDATTPHFENVYSFSGPPRESQYSGHVNEFVSMQNNGPPLAPLFRTETEEVQVPPGHFMVMGDNTMNSSDSRTWGDFPRENVFGKYFFVYWPITQRFGWSAR